MPNNPSVMAKGHDTSPNALRALGEALLVRYRTCGGRAGWRTRDARPYDAQTHPTLVVIAGAVGAAI